MPADRANDKEVFVTLEDVMKEKCLDHVTTLWGLDEKTIEEDFKAVDTDEDGKVTLEEGLKVYQYLRETAMTPSIQKCLYTCCYTWTPPTPWCRDFEQPSNRCEAKFEKRLIKYPFNAPSHFEVCTLKAVTTCKSPRPDDCETNPYSIES